MEHLEAATEEDYKFFYKTFYVPNNAILSIAGDIDIVQTKKDIAQYFGDIPKGTAPIYRPNITEPPLTAGILDTVYDNIQLPAVFQAYRIPAQGTDDFYAVSMLGTVLSDGESSRMFRSIVDEQQKALQVATFPFPSEDPGLNLVFGIANMGVGVADLEEAMNAEIDRVKKELISEEEFQKLRNKVENNFITANGTVVGIAESLANYKMYFGDANLINTELNRYLKVTREDIREAARKYFNEKNRISLHYLPKPTQP
jgi:predicted Zn-dependent peptidase